MRWAGEVAMIERVSVEQKEGMMMRLIGQCYFSIYQSKQAY